MESLRSQNLQTSGGKLCKVLRTGCSAGFQMIKSVGTGRSERRGLCSRRPVMDRAESWSGGMG